MRKPKYPAVRQQLLTAPGRGWSAIRDAAEDSGNETVAIRVGVTEENQVLIGSLPIDAPIIVVVVVVGTPVARVVVILARNIRQRKQVHDFGHVRIDAGRGDGVIGKRLTRGGVVDGRVWNAQGCAFRRAEIADALVGQWHRG